MMLRKNARPAVVMLSGCVWATCLAVMVWAHSPPDPLAHFTRLSTRDTTPPAGYLDVRMTCAGRPCTPRELADICLQTCGCAGFNSNGFIKGCTTPDCGARWHPVWNVDLYVARSPTPPGPDHPVPLVDDWHYPREEAAEAAGLAVPLVQSIHLAAADEGERTAVLRDAGSGSDAASVTVRVGDVAFGAWWVRSILDARGAVPPSLRACGTPLPLVVLERDFARWGVVAYVGLGAAAGGPGVLAVLRKGVGEVAGLRQPRFTMEAEDATYMCKVTHNASDYIAARVLRDAPLGEPTYERMASYMAPARDYALVGVPESYDKWNVAPDGRIKMADGPIYSPASSANDTGPGTLVFDPRAHVAHWPATNFTDYKSSLVGGHLNVVAVGAWDARAARGFAMTVVADGTQFLVRVADVGGGAQGYRYLSGGRDRRAAPLPAPADFYVPLLRQHLRWRAFFVGDDTVRREVGAAFAASCTWRAVGGRQARLRAAAAAAAAAATTAAAAEDVGSGMQLRLPGRDGQRLLHVSRAVLQSTLSVFLQNHANYGDGYDYWSMTPARGDPLPLTLLASVSPLLLWGQPEPAASLVGYYLDMFVTADGMIDLGQWKPECSFSDGLADYGRLLDLFVATARAIEPLNATWVPSHLPQAQAMARYTLDMHSFAQQIAPPHHLLHGLIYGPAEHDTCLVEDYYLNVNAWTWRGMVEMSRWLNATGRLPELAAELATHARSLNESLARAVAASTLVVAPEEPRAVFVAPTVGSTVPYGVMTQTRESSYANFRYYTELLAADVLPRDLAAGLAQFRETHGGCISGVTRYDDHLDDMPSSGYAEAGLLVDRVQAFHLLLLGHVANYQARGVFTATEQLGSYTDADPRYRAYLSPGGTEVDIDLCVPSTTLPAFMVRWALALEERDVDAVWLMRGAFRDWFASRAADLARPAWMDDPLPTWRGRQCATAVQHLPTRFGELDMCVGSDVLEPGKREQPDSVWAEVHARFTGRSREQPPLLHIRLRDPTGTRRIARASVSGGQLVRLDADADVVTVRPAGSGTVSVVARFETGAAALAELAAAMAAAEDAVDM